MSTKIEWTQETWNPIGGCRRKSPGCFNCYAERQAYRMQHNPNAKISERYAGLTQITNGHIGWTGETFIDEEVLLQPLKRKKPTTYFISLSDLFFAERPITDIRRVFRTMQQAHWHTFQVLTKYADRMASEMPEIYEWLSHFAPHGKAYDEAWIAKPLPNVHLGVSVENQQYADERIPKLLATPAALRFVSYEPALGPIDWNNCAGIWQGCVSPKEEHEREHDGGLWCDERSLDWVIVGGESGPGARPFDIQWARNTIAQCRAADVPVFVKQVGARPICNTADVWPEGTRYDASEIPNTHNLYAMRAVLADKKGGVMEEWPEDLRVRELPLSTGNARD